MIEINNTIKQKINIAKTKRVVEAFLRAYKKADFTVSVAIIGPARMQKLNKTYRGIDRPTDVLSFAGTKEKGQEKYLGEVIINIAEVKKANKYLEVFGLKKAADYIFYFLLVHGLLHLVGYNDDREVDRLKMLNLGERFLEEWL